MSDELVCYCFGHSADEIERDALANGRSTIATAITDACRRGLARCADANPTGRCCLGNVRARAKAAMKKGP